MRQVFVSTSSALSLLVCTHRHWGIRPEQYWRLDKGPSFRHSRLIRKERCNDGETGISVNWICVIYVCRGRFWLHLAVVRGR